MSYLIFTLLLITPFISAEVQDTSSVTIQFISSSQFSEQPSQKFNQGSAPQESPININANKKYQTIKGAGAALTDSSAFVLRQLPQAKYQEVLKNLFDLNSGLGISYIRLPISASDLALNNWTYDDMPDGQTDPYLEQFAINHDYGYIIPVLKDILAINPNVKIMVTPWSPPAWMKNTKTLWGQKDSKQSSLIHDYYSTYANFFVKTIQAYAKQGIKFDTMSVQNEPMLATSNYPGMVMQQEEQVDFINNYLAPAFLKHNITTQVLVHDFNWDREGYAAYVLSNLSEDAKKIVRGTSFHCYGGDVSAQTTLHNKFPNLPIYLTECSNGQWAPDVPEALINDMRKVFIEPANNWAEVFMKWGLALDQNFGPNNGGCATCWPLVKINTQTKEVTYGVDYYSTGAFSKFVKPGAQRIDVTTSDSNLLVTGFVGTDGAITVIVANQVNDYYEFTLIWGEKWIQSTLPAKNVGVFKWKP